MSTPQQALVESFGLPSSNGGHLDEAEFLQHLADAIDYWMQHRMERLMSLCYTLDVDEAAVAQAFHPAAPEPANVGLAKLLYERQKQRIHTKRTVKSPPVDEAEAW